MKQALLSVLACPNCGGELALEASEATDGEVMTGILKCAGCDSSYAIDRGVPRMNLAMDPLRNVAATFSFEWKEHFAGAMEEETLFGRTRDEDWQMVRDGMQIRDEAVRGAVVLDAGCGSARFSHLFAEHGAAMVVGIDINEAVDGAFAASRGYPDVHIVQANIFQLPFRRQVFDLVWCNGVIHHTPDAAGAHRSLSGHVRLGGILYVWVYAKRFNPFRAVKTAFDAVGLSKLSPQAIMRIAKGITYPSLVMLAVYRGIRRVPGFRPRGSWGKRTVRPRTVSELQLTWFDALSPEFDTRHTEAEVIGWFEREGFTDIVPLDEPKVGVRGVAR